MASAKSPARSARPFSDYPRLIARVEAFAQSRFALPFVVLVAPLLLALCYPNAMFPARFDPWVSAAWARDFDYMTDRWPDTYYFTRFAVTLPGRAIFSLLPDLEAKLAWDLVYEYLLLASLAGVLRRFFGQTYALVGTLFVATDVSVMFAFGGGQMPNGVAVAYIATAMYTTVRAADSLSAPSRRNAAMGWFFLTGVFCGLALWTYGTVVLWALVLPILLAGRLEQLKPLPILSGGLFVAAGFLLSTVAHALVFHHYTGDYDFWRASVNFLRFTNQTGAWQVPASRYVHDLLNGPWLLHLSLALITYGLSLGVCVDSWRLVRKLNDPCLVICAVLVAMVTAQMLPAIATDLSSSYYVVAYVFYTPVGIPALVAVAAHLRRRSGTTLPFYLLGVGGAARLVLDVVPGSTGAIWQLTRDLTLDHSGALMLALALSGAISTALLLDRYPRVASAVAVTAIAVALAMNSDLGRLVVGHGSLVSASAIRGAELSGLQRTGGLSANLAEPRPAFESLLHDPYGFNARDNYVATLHGVDLLRRQFAGGRFGFVFNWLNDGNSGVLAGAIASNQLFEYSQVTREWPEYPCAVASRFPSIVVAGSTWTQTRASVEPLLACGVKPVFRDADLVASGSSYAYLVTYDLPAGTAVATITPDRFRAINEGRGELKDGAFSLTSDSRQFAFSADAPLPTTLSGPVVLRIYLTVNSGYVGVFVTDRNDNANILHEAFIQQGTKEPYVDLPLADISRSSLLTLRNLAPVGTPTLVQVSKVEVLKPTEQAVVPATGASFKLPRTAISYPPQDPNADIVSMPIERNGAGPESAKVFIRATPRGFDGQALVLDAQGNVMASAALPRDVSSGITLELPDFARAGSLVIRTGNKKAHDISLKVESALVLQ